MKELVAVVSTVFATAIVARVFVGSAASNPLYEERGLACGVMDGNGSIQITYASYLVQQSNGRGQLECLHSGPNDDGKREVLNILKRPGLLCGTPAGATADWKNQISADGSVRLVCAVADAAAAAASSGAGLG